MQTFNVNIFSHLFRPKLLWKTNLKRIKSYRIYISSNSRPEQVTEVIFIKYLWEENSLFLYKLVNFFKTLRRNITGDFLDGLVLLWYIWPEFISPSIINITLPKYIYLRYMYLVWNYSLLSSIHKFHQNAISRDIFGNYFFSV